MSEEADLLLLAQRGFAAVRPKELDRLAGVCQEQWLDSGDSRYHTLGRTFRSLSAWWREHDESGGIPFELAREIEQLLTSSLGPILSAQRDQGAALASDLSDAIAARLTDSGTWLAQGLARRSDRPIN
jgi:hypothetical protein